MEINSQNRNYSLDILKGLAIILVVIGHAKCPFHDEMLNYINYIFFLISGYFFNEKYSSDWGSVLKYVSKKFKTLYIPFIATNILFLWLHNFFFKIYFYTTNPDIINYGYTGAEKYLSFGQIIKNTFLGFVLYYQNVFGGATWFLKVLFFISISYCIAVFCLKKMKLKYNIFHLMMFIFASISLFIGYFLHKSGFNFYSIWKIFYYLFVFYLGFIYKELIAQRKIVPIHTTFTICIIVILLLLFGYYNLFLSTNLLIKIPVAVFCIGILYTLSYAIQKFLPQKLNGFLIYIGQNTISILCMHIFFFKFVTLAEVLIYQKPLYVLGCFNCWDADWFWWIIYGIAGVVLPLCARYLWHKVLKIKN